MSRGISEGKRVVKFAIMSNRGRVCLVYQNETTIMQNETVQVSTRFIVCCEDFHSRYCIPRSDNDQFYP